MASPHTEQMTIEAELAAPMATVQLARFEVDPGEAELPCAAGLRLDLSLTPRTPNARISYRDRWAAHRFEPPGKVFVVPPGEAVRARTDGGRQFSVVLTLAPDALGCCLGREIDWSDRLIEASLDVPGTLIPMLLARLGEEARHPGLASAALGEAIAAQIMIELGRYYLGLEDCHRAGGLSPWRLRLIEERLRDPRASATLTELAALCGLSVRQLTRGFRASCGRSIGERVAERRMQAAHDLLAADHGIKQVAYAMGFRSPSAFCHAFRKSSGHSPKDYRRRLLS